MLETQTTGSGYKPEPANGRFLARQECLAYPKFMPE